MLKLFFFPLVFSILLLVDALVLPSSVQKIITAEPGDVVTLPCVVPDKNDFSRIMKWIKSGLNVDHIIFYKISHFDEEIQVPSFKGRLFLNVSDIKDGNVSLTLRNVTTADTGTYECRIFDTTVKQWIPTCIIHLDVGKAGDTNRSRRDQGEENKPTKLALICVLVVLVAVVVLGVVIYKCHQNSNPPPAEPEPEQHEMLPSPNSVQQDDEVLEAETGL
ncbi:coxsackievirus and adenovirus receptor homolog [Kryptolebias marmoratus]|uniref:coxsackievirus and adenovirus receptor homolog n=1 Tax=Kryptolebias marmoratus TaxID=37003 RepID=UPI0018ACDC9B|nr:coxsackievirus and adenovirus receptor homolog [Kryptolebias marmoratus]